MSTISEHALARVRWWRPLPDNSTKVHVCDLTRPDWRPQLVRYVSGVCMLIDPSCWVAAVTFRVCFLVACHLPQCLKSKLTNEKNSTDHTVTVVAMSFTVFLNVDYCKLPEKHTTVFTVSNFLTLQVISLNSSIGLSQLIVTHPHRGAVVNQ